MKLSKEALQTRREYMREYREANKERLQEYNAEWRKNNPDKIKAAQERYWERQVEKQKETLA